MKAWLIIILIITIFPMHVIAGSPDGVRPGVLPGEFFYFADRLGEWIDINLLTLATRAKQKKLVLAADERVQEFASMADAGDDNPSHYQTALSRYRGALERGEDVMEKLLFLDGAEIERALDFESATRRQEQELYQLLPAMPTQVEVFVLESLNFARASNQKMFEYIVVNYQFTQDDIDRYGAIVGEHLDFALLELDKRSLSATSEVNQARELLRAGLNIDAYIQVNRAKNILYAALLAR